MLPLRNARQRNSKTSKQHVTHKEYMLRAWSQLVSKTVAAVIGVVVIIHGHLK